MAGPLRDKVNERFSSTGIIDETHVIGEDVTNEVELDEAPEPGTTITVTGPSSTPTYTRVAAAPSAGEFQVVNEATGRLLFNASDNGNSLEIDYQGTGSKALARDVNRVHRRLDATEPVGGIFAAEQTITAAANIELDPRSEQSVYIFLDTNIQLDDFTDLPAGASGLIVLEQDGSGGNTVTFDTAWRQIGSGSVSTTADKITVINWYIRGTGILYTVVAEA